MQCAFSLRRVHLASYVRAACEVAMISTVIFDAIKMLTALCKGHA